MEIDDAMVRKALDAEAEYWADESNSERCEECRGSGHVPVGFDGDREYCDSCGGNGTVHMGTEEGAMRAALAAVMFSAA